MVPFGRPSRRYISGREKRGLSSDNAVKHFKYNEKGQKFGLCNVTCSSWMLRSPTGEPMQHYQNWSLGHIQNWTNRTKIKAVVMCFPHENEYD